MKVLVILGTRPEVIKLAPVISELRGRTDTIICSTGQHRELAKQAMEAFSVRPDISLDAMSPGNSLNILSSKILESIDSVLQKVNPDWIIVQGDTTTAFCAGLAGFHRQFRVAHVEAGLRTGSLAHPFPEEANRSLLARIASRHFAPTQFARKNLLAEGISDDLIYVTGNTIVDTITSVKNSWKETNLHLPDTIRPFIKDAPIVLVTCHRRENFGEVLQGICKMLRRLCIRYANYTWIFPLHLNPAVRHPVMNSLTDIPNLFLTDPLDYHSTLYLIERSALIISDSGGIQEEAPSFGVPVVIMRSCTERMEGVSAGFATLAGQDPSAIEKAAVEWLESPSLRLDLKNRPNPYGDGMASKRIVSNLMGEPILPFHG